jgi:hypothetical protein
MIFQNSSLEIYNDFSLIRTMKEYVFRLRLSEEQHRELKRYIGYLPPDMILFGLRFAFNRSRAVSGGYLMPGRKSTVKKETRLLSKSQAEWRLKNWKSMIKSYRQKGYSYPTISRIKKQIYVIATK